MHCRCEIFQKTSYKHTSCNTVHITAPVHQKASYQDQSLIENYRIQLPSKLISKKHFKYQCYILQDEFSSFFLWEWIEPSNSDILRAHLNASSL